MKKKLFLVTDCFPYGKGEKTFIIPELPYLRQNYDVTIITRAGRQVMEDVDDITKLEPEIKVIHIIDYMKTKKPNALQRKLRILYLFDRTVRQEFADIIKGSNAIHRLKYMFSYYANARKFLYALKKAELPLESQEPIVFYTYWHTYATLALLMCKEKNPNLKVITRTHGYDLYNERTNCGRQPFRAYANSSIDAIFFISRLGLNYYAEKFSKGSILPIFRLNRLGIHNLCRIEHQKSEGAFQLVSCSNVVPGKRVEMIIDALAKIDSAKEINWVHFGDGQNMKAVKEKASQLLDKKKNISYAFAGFVPNNEIMQYYIEHYIDCFITTTVSEGIPVSIMEACSFGIPIIATNVGGIPEIVEDNVNGLLLHANPDVSEVKNAIEQLYDMPEEQTMLMRHHSRKIWEEGYDGQKNFAEFVKCLDDI